MAFFKITLIRSAIGLPKQTAGVLQALGLRKRMRTVFHPVSQEEREEEDGVGESIREFCGAVRQGVLR